MPAKTHQGLRVPLADQVQGIAKMEAFDGPTRALEQAVLAGGLGDY